MNRLPQASLDQLFIQARTQNGWLDRPVPDEVLRELHELAKWGPTAANTCPLRVVFVRSAEGKERLLPCMAPGNMEKTKAAPVTAILGMDMEFYEKLPKLFPHADARSWFAGNPAAIEENAFRNSSLQAAYFMLAARSLGLDCGPMGGFDKDKINAAFFAGTTHRVNFLCNLGFGDAEKLYPRSPRLAFEDACVLA
jgi:nitroreductase